MPQCEFCERPAKWRMFMRARNYERFACADHALKVKRLISIDWSYTMMRYEFEAVEVTRGAGGE